MKTLNNILDEQPGINTGYKIRQAAIEWVKKEIELTVNREAVGNLVQSAIHAGRVDIMKEFFNLTEEDLK